MNRINEVIEELRATFQKKQEQYKGATTDIFRNFNQGAALQSESPQQTLLGYVNKHMVNLFDAKKYNPERLQDEKYINEVAGDIAVYMIILMAMVRGGKDVKAEGYPFVFPESKFVKDNSIEDQVKHIESEVQEIKATVNRTELLEETLDCIHSCETLLRILSHARYDFDINQVKNKVIEKNKNRGYYKK